MLLQSSEYKISSNKGVGGTISGKTNKSVRPFSAKAQKQEMQKSMCWREKLPKNNKSGTLIFGTPEQMVYVLGLGA